MGSAAEVVGALRSVGEDVAKTAAKHAKVVRGWKVAGRMVRARRVREGSHVPQCPPPHHTGRL